MPSSSKEGRRQEPREVRRTFPRFKVKGAELHLHLRGDLLERDAPLDVELVNLSRNGLQFMCEADVDLSQTTLLNMTLDLPGDPQWLVTAGEVCWEKYAAGGKWKVVGIAFTDLTSLQRAGLRELESRMLPRRKTTSSGNAEDRRTASCPICGGMVPEGRVLCEKCTSWNTKNTFSATALAPSSSAAQGIVLEDNYRLLEEIGRGAMGTVFRAMDMTLDRIVAVKFLRPEYEGNEAFVWRFQHEARSMATIQHQNVIRIFSFGTFGPASFFVMEHIEGETAEARLFAALGRSKLLDIEDVVRILHDVSRGLVAIHHANVAHRDIKPANIMIDTSRDRAVIMDFGLGRRYTSMTQDSVVFAGGGTPAYMAPEVFSDHDDDPEIAKLADIYSFGATAYELLTGRLPFDGNDVDELRQAQATTTPPSPSNLRPDLPRGLDEVVMRCLEQDAKDRYGSCVALREALVAVTTERQPGRHSTLPGSEAPSDVHEICRTSVVPAMDPVDVRILIADLDPGTKATVLSSARTLFSGVRFQAARSAPVALRLARQNRPHVVVAPVRGRFIDGLELAALLRSDHDLDAVKLVLVSDRITAEDRRVMTRLGVFHVMLSPVDVEELSTVLRRAVVPATKSETPVTQSATGSLGRPPGT